MELQRRKGDTTQLDDQLKAIHTIAGCEQVQWESINLVSSIYAVKPGDGSAREQAASCQRVLGAGANIAKEYATKRYRSNLINWGMVPFQIDEPSFGLNDSIFVPNIKQALEKDFLQSIPAYVLKEDGCHAISLHIAPLTVDERQILLDGCLINYYKNH